MTENQSVSEPKRALVVAAHPDDPEFGCAGTVAKWAAEGQEVHYLLLTSGDQGNRDRSVHPSVMASLREEEQRAAAEVLGVKSVEFLRYPDGMLENTMDLRRRLCGLMRRYRPHALLTIDPWRPYQLHPDHRAAGQAALDAARACHAWYLFPEQLSELEPWCIKEVYLFWSGAADYWEDVTDYMDLRMEALARHASQMRGQIQAFENRMRRSAEEAGAPHGYRYAEAFKHLDTG